MQTERVTFLTSPDNKAALDAYAARTGKSVGHVLREAARRYLAQEADEEPELAALVEEANRAIPRMRETLDSMIATLEATNAKVAATLRAAGIRP
jgi:hypothetical protein